MTPVGQSTMGSEGEVPGVLRFGRERYFGAVGIPDGSHRVSFPSASTPCRHGRSAPERARLSSRRTRAPRHRRHIALALATLVAGLALVWPVYPLFGGIRPLVLGLPLSLAWVVLWLAVVFLALLIAFFSERE